ncbi:MAG: LysR family transcriptional regulator [Clostridiales bacterium]|nr:LysR family transcriptional regulator [Clostridiales bacterium]
MSTKLDLYRIFCKVAQCNSFSKASKELYMTQPAVSQAIMQLETELDIRLFTRTPRGVILTKEGQMLFEYINSAINLINVAEQKLLESKNLLVGELKIGVGDTISKHYLLPYLEEFHNRFPNIKFKIINGTTPELCVMLKSGELDLSICNLPISDASIEVREVLTIHDTFVCGKNFLSTISMPLSLSQLAELPLILLEPKSNSRRYIENYFLSKGISLMPEIELGSHDLLLELAKINLGIACVIREFSHEYLKKGLLYEIKLTEKIPARNIGVCFLKRVSLSPTSMKFIELIGLNM